MNVQSMLFFTYFTYAFSVYCLWGKFLSMSFDLFERSDPSEAKRVVGNAMLLRFKICKRIWARKGLEHQGFQQIELHSFSLDFY